MTQANSWVISRGNQASSASCILLRDLQVFILNLLIPVSLIHEFTRFLYANSDAIKVIAARHKALKISVFGSVARGEDGPESDIDFLVTFTPDDH